MKKGKFIVIDGGEGCGKSSQMKLLQEKYTGQRFIFTREPGGAPFAEKIRSLILSPEAKGASGETQFGLFWAARADHMNALVKPSLLAGKNVISDRFDSSSYAYQVFGQEAKHLKKLFLEMRKVYLGKFVPDLYIFLDVKPEVGLARVASRKGEINHFDEQKLDFHKRIRKGYLDFVKKFPHKIIDANKSFDEVAADLEKAINLKI